ncbi:MAG: hypothetical protein KH721_09500, partial [Collinsella sp.]|nr:hypothetical protein [Collinsella sp.]
LLENSITISHYPKEDNMTFYLYEFYADSDKDEFLIEWLSDEQIANIAKECDYDFVKCYESVGMGCKGKFLYEKELEA